MLLHQLDAINQMDIVLASASPRRQELLGKMVQPYPGQMSANSATGLTAADARSRQVFASSQGVRFRVEVSTFEETLDKASFLSSGDYVQATALGKLTSVVQRMRQQVPSQMKSGATNWSCFQFLTLSRPVLCCVSALQGPPPGPNGLVIISADTIVVCDGNILEKPLDAKEATGMLQRLSGRDHTVETGATRRPNIALDPDTRLRRGCMLCCVRGVASAIVMARFGEGWRQGSAGTGVRAWRSTSGVV